MTIRSFDRNSGTPSFPRLQLEPKFNLLMIVNPKLLMSENFIEIGNFVRGRAPDIRVILISDSVKSRPLLKKAEDRPTLAFSPMVLHSVRPKRGKVYSGQPLPKLDQMRMLKRFGIPVPRWTTIEPDTHLSPEEWGPLVVVKPSAFGAATSSRGINAQLTEEMRYRFPQSYPKGHPGRLGPMIAQQFIDTGARPAQIRVLTLFGTPLYAEEIRARNEQVFPDPVTKETLERFNITPVTEERDRAFVYDKDVLDLARRVYSAVPEVPLQAVDIIREAQTGKLYVLEINPGGNTWHFSSKYGRHQLIEGRKREDQFDAFQLAADVLIERTRREAC